MPMSRLRRRGLALSLLGHGVAGYLLLAGEWRQPEEAVEPIAVELLREAGPTTAESGPDRPSEQSSPAQAAGSEPQQAPPNDPPPPPSAAAPATPTRPDPIAATPLQPTAPTRPIVKTQRPPAPQPIGVTQAPPADATPGPPPAPSGPPADVTGKRGVATDDARHGGEGSVRGVVPPSQAQPEPGNMPPDYPQLARLRSQEGTVRLAVRIDAEGRVADLRIIESSGYALLDRAARQAVERWRFRPATRNGRPVADEVVVPVVFRFASQPGPTTPFPSERTPR